MLTVGPRKDIREANKDKNNSLEESNFLHNEQYGFREGRSTEHAIMAALDRVREVKNRGHYQVLISVDIKGAFDNIQWDFIKTTIRNAQIESGFIPLVDSYPSNRKVLFMDRNKAVKFAVSKGCPHGSCLGPLFWTLVADHILKKVTQSRRFTAFAYDFLLLEEAT